MQISGETAKQPLNTSHPSIQMPRWILMLDTNEVKLLSLNVQVDEKSQKYF